MRSLTSYFFQAAEAVGLVNLEEALVMAASQGKTNTARALLEAGAYVHFLGDSPLALAAEGGHTETVKALLDAGANVHAWDDTPLVHAAGNGYTDIVKVLLKAGADVHAQRDLALQSAVSWDRAQTARTLLEAGANVFAGGVVDARRQPEMAELVRQWGARAVARLTAAAPNSRPSPLPTCSQ